MNWFLRDFGYDSDLLNQDQIDDKALLKLRGVVRTSYVTLNGRFFKTSKPLLRQRSGKSFRAKPSAGSTGRGTAITLSHTQIIQYLRCPRSYRYRYLDGWQEKETHAAMAFGRCFEKALAAYFSGEDCSAALFKEWGTFRDIAFEYKKGESWDRLVHQGVHLSQRFAQDDRVKIRRPEQDLQVKMVRSLPSDNEFVAYIDALGELDGTQCLIDWKTTTSRHSEEPAGLLSLDPQMICYSWISGIPDVAVIVFVRKSIPEIQY